MTAPTGSAAVDQHEVTVVVVTYNSRRFVEPLFASLDDGLRGVAKAEIVVVDNDSRDDTVAAVRAARPDVAVVQTGGNLGYSAGINAGMRAATMDGTLLVLNPDVRLRPGSVARLLDALATPGTGITVPRMVDLDGRTWASLRRDPSVSGAWSEALLGGTRAARLGLGETVAVGDAYATERPVAWATGAVLAVSARCRRAVGDWDEGYFLYSEEVDYCQRARDLGFAVRYVPSAVAEHVGGDSHTDPSLRALLVRNKVLHYRRRHGRVRGALFRSGVVVGELLRAPRAATGAAGLRAALTARPSDLARS